MSADPGVKITIEPQYVPRASRPEGTPPLYVFAYHVRVENQRHDTVRLIARHWAITDGNGHTEHVRGPGVVGQTPTLKPGESFEYSSGCPLPTPVGFMHGEFQMLSEHGTAFLAPVPGFRMARPGVLN